MWAPEEIERVAAVLMAQLGKPYSIAEPGFNGDWELRGKPKLTNTNPLNFDCSGFSRWGIGQGRDEHGRTIFLPHGAAAQIEACKALVMQPPQILDLGFANLHGSVDHVIIRINDKEVIEARGFQQGKDYDKVILRPIAVWEKQKGFLGWWRVPGIHD